MWQLIASPNSSVQIIQHHFLGIIIKSLISVIICSVVDPSLHQSCLIFFVSGTLSLDGSFAFRSEERRILMQYWVCCICNSYRGGLLFAPMARLAFQMSYCVDNLCQRWLFNLAIDLAIDSTYPYPQSLSHIHAALTRSARNAEVPRSASEHRL